MVTWLCNGYRDKEEAMTHSFIPSANIYWVLKYECLDTEVRGYADVWQCGKNMALAVMEFIF